MVQLTRRPGTQTAYLTLRDPDVDMSLNVTVRVTTLDAMAVPLTEGARVVVQAKPTFWTKRGTLQLDARQVRPVGVGELLARLEHLKRVLAAEGLFERERKKPLPFLPRRVGLICGRGSAAEKDVVENARRRWPVGASSRSARSPVQGPDAVTEVSAALRELDARPGPSTSSSSPAAAGRSRTCCRSATRRCVRAVADARTPVVSAIGHDVDTPLLDFVADVPGVHADRRRPSWWCPTLARAARRGRRHPGTAAPGRRHARRPPSGATWSPCAADR